METKEIIQNKIDNLKSQLEPLEKELNNIYERTSDETDAKIKLCEQLKDKFNEDELIFSAEARCQCGAGLAYAKTTSPRGSWYCSDMLLGNALPKSDVNSKTHDASFPFAFYNIKSDNQPSANGATTRKK